MTPQDHARDARGRMQSLYKARYLNNVADSNAHMFPPAEALQEYEHGEGNAVSFATVIVGAVVVAIMIWSMVS
jgi:hypothetical protein